MAYRITARGYPGDRWQPPESTEVVGDCPECGAEDTDLQTNDTPWPGATVVLWCTRCGADFEAVLVDEPDEDWRHDDR